MNTAILIVPGRLHSTASRARQERRPAVARPAVTPAAVDSRTGGNWLAVSHWLGDAFATWASGGRAL